MTAEIVTLDREIIFDGVTIEPDKILEQLKGKLTEIVIVGTDKDGDVAVYASHGSEKTAWMLQAGMMMNINASLKEDE